MKLVITGASGPFGYNTTKGLLERGVRAEDLILISRNPDKLSAFADLGATIRQGDFDDHDSLLTAFAGGEKMLMISTNRVGQREPQHRNAVNAARQAGIRHIVYTSFVGRPENDDSIAVHDHRFTENLLRQSGMRWTFLRNSQYLEAMRDAAAPAALKSGQWLSATGDGRIAMISREDCIRAAVAVMGTDGHEDETYDITGPELITYRELCELVAELADRPIAYKAVSADEMYAFFDSLGIPRTARDDHVVGGYGWCSEDMVSFETMLKNGGFAILSDDLENLTGRKAESPRAYLSRYRDRLTGPE